MFSDLITAAKEGDQAAFAELCESYKPLISSMTERYSSAVSNGYAVEKDDLRQEATVAFYRAVVTFDVSQNEVSFGLYAKICIRNKMVSLLRRSKKRQPSRTRGENVDKTGRLTDLYLDRDELAELSRSLLSAKERKVFLLYADGKSYKDIMADMSLTKKSVDNALFRAKSKLKKHYRSE